MIRFNVAKILKERGKTPYWLSRQTGLTIPTVYAITASRTQRVEFSTLNLLCKTLGCAVGELLIYDDEEMEQKGNKLET